MHAPGFLKVLQRRGRPAHEAALALGAGALAAYGQPGIGLAPMMPIALIALSFWAARARSFFAAARIGIAFGLGIFWVITISSREWTLLVPIVLTLVGTGLYALPQTLLAHAVSRRSFGLAAFCATAAVWKLCMDAGDYLGFPTKGEGLAAIAGAPVLMAGARLVGSSLVCGIMVSGTIGCGVRLAESAPLRLARIPSALAPLTAALGLLLLASATAHISAPKAESVLQVGIPQMNVPSVYFAQRMQHPELTDAFEEVLAKQLRELADVDLLALTETYDGSYSLLVPKVRRRFQNYARQQQQAVLLSSYLAAEDGGIYNAVGSIDASGRLVAVHRKVNLAPFGEVEYEHGSAFRAAAILPGVRVGILICQESLLTEGPHALASSGANLLVSRRVTSLSTAGCSASNTWRWHRMRAIETGRSLVWASAGGPSGAVDRWGNFEAGGPLRGPAAVRASVELHDEVTPYLRTIMALASAGHERTAAARLEATAKNEERAGTTRSSGHTSGRPGTRARIRARWGLEHWLRGRGRNRQWHSRAGPGQRERTDSAHGAVPGRGVPRSVPNRSRPQCERSIRLLSGFLRPENRAERGPVRSTGHAR